MKKFKNIKSAKIALSMIVLLSFGTACRKDMNGLNQDLKLLPQPLLSIDGKEASILLPGMMTNIESPVNYIYQGQQDLGQDEYAGYTAVPSVFLGNVNNFTYSFQDDWVNYCWDTPQQNILNTWLQWKLKKFDTKYIITSSFDNFDSKSSKNKSKNDSNLIINNNHTNINKNYEKTSSTWRNGFSLYVLCFIES